MKITKDFSNKLLKRRELELVFSSDGNPGIEKAKKEVVAELKAKDELVVIKSLKNNFGNKDFRVSVFVYGDAENMKLIEPKKKEKKKVAA